MIDVIRVDSRVEVLDETSPFYHLVGDVVAVRANGRAIVQFAEKDHAWNYPNDSRQVEFAPDQVGLALEGE